MLPYLALIIREVRIFVSGAGEFKNFRYSSSRWTALNRTQDFSCKVLTSILKLKYWIMLNQAPNDISEELRHLNWSKYISTSKSTLESDYFVRLLANFCKVLRIISIFIVIDCHRSCWPSECRILLIAELPNRGMLFGRDVTLNEITSKLQLIRYLSYGSLKIDKIFPEIRQVF